MQSQSSIGNDEVSEAATSFNSWDRNYSTIDTLSNLFATPVISVRVYSCNSWKTNFEPAYLVHQQPQFHGQIKLLEPGFILLNLSKGKTKILPESSPMLANIIGSPQNAYKFLSKISQYSNILNQNCFDIHPPENNLPIADSGIQKSTFIHLREKGFNSMSLKTDDVIKLGKEVYRVTIIDETAQPNLSWNAFRAHPPFLGGICRICLSSEQQPDNYIVNPCGCSGSCAFVHIQCLRHWVSMRVIIYRKQNVIAYNLEAFFCQICRNPLPTCLRIKNQRIDLLPTKLYFRNFVMFQRISTSRTTAFVVPCQEGRSIQLKIGRSEHNDIIMKEMSISRTHAFLKIYGGGEVQLSDNRSKFGTYVCFRRSICNIQNVTLSSDRFVYNVELGHVI